MPSLETELYPSRVEGALFAPIHDYRDRLEIRVLADDIEIFELLSPADHGAIDV